MMKGMPWLRPRKNADFVVVEAMGWSYNVGNEFGYAIVGQKE